ncbi:MAG TPA: Xaa-Pro peptidase family protein [Vicinamibacterales bacterium]|nr:Xaa-Pro peptidase family protein [Vicinamibacterales bacterium]
MNVPADTVRARLARVRGNARAAGVDALVVTHLPNLQYLTGFTGSSGAALVLPRACLLIVDFRYVTAATELISGLDGLVTLETFERSYDEALVDVLRRERAARIGIEAAYLPVSRFNAISSGLASRSALPIDVSTTSPALVPTERLVEQTRVIKDDLEIAALREGGRRLGAIARRVADFVREGRTERAVAADIEAAMRGAGFSRPAFETIVASGPNSALPHARPTAREIRPGDPTVLDFGGVYDGYCVDLTRTVQLGATSTALARLYGAVAEAQQAAIAAVRPGVPASAIDAAARNVLQNHGLAEAFGHGTGHGLGLEVHEEPRIARLWPRLADPLIEPGMVFTIEPGAYVPGVGGVRIEDDILVTETGCEILTRQEDGG